MLPLLPHCCSALYNSVHHSRVLDSPLLRGGINSSEPPSGAQVTLRSAAQRSERFTTGVLLYVRLRTVIKILNESQYKIGLCSL